MPESFSLFRPAVRLSLRNFPAWLLDHYRDIRQGLGNLCRWFPVIWHDEDFDWDCLARVMETKLRWMVADTSTWHTMSRDRDRKNMLVCAELLKRLRDDDYWVHQSKRIGKTTMAAKLAQKQAEHEQKLLGKIIGREMRGWWD